MITELTQAQKELDAMVMRLQRMEEQTENVLSNAEVRQWRA
jgi:hypothetical protein